MSDLGGSLHCRSLSLFLLQVVISIHYLATSDADLLAIFLA